MSLPPPLPMPIQTYPRHAIIFAIFLLSKLVAAQQPPQSSYNLSPAMATAVIVMVIVFFSIGFVSVYIRQFMLYLGVNLGGQDGGIIENWGRGRLSQGLDPKIVDTFPTFLYSDVKMHRIGKSVLECAICLNEFTDLEILRMLPPCSHVFHPQCVSPWLASHVTCPVCRANLEISESSRSLSFNYLAHQFDQSSEDDNCEPSDRNHDVIVHVGTSQEKIEVEITSPVADRTGKLQRSHSTGHSLIDDCERHTLRLTDEVRNKLTNINLSGLPAAIVSPPVGYRAMRVGCTYTGNVKPDHWRFSVSPPFISRSRKSDSPLENNNSSTNSSGIMSGPRNLFKSIKSPLNRVGRTDNIGERSTNQLWVNRTNQDLELEGSWNEDQ